MVPGKAKLVPPGAAIDEGGANGTGARDLGALEPGHPRIRREPREHGGGTSSSIALTVQGGVADLGRPPCYPGTEGEIVAVVRAIGGSGAAALIKAPPGNGGSQHRRPGGFPGTDVLARTLLARIATVVGGKATERNVHSRINARRGRRPETQLKIWRSDGRTGDKERIAIEGRGRPRDEIMIHRGARRAPDHTESVTVVLPAQIIAQGDAVSGTSARPARHPDLHTGARPMHDRVVVEEMPARRLAGTGTPQHQRAGLWRHAVATDLAQDIVGKLEVLHPTAEGHRAATIVEKALRDRIAAAWRLRHIHRRHGGTLALLHLDAGHYRGAPTVRQAHTTDIRRAGVITNMMNMAVLQHDRPFSPRGHNATGGLARSAGLGIVRDMVDVQIRQGEVMRAPRHRHTLHARALGQEGTIEDEPIHRHKTFAARRVGPDAHQGPGGRQRAGAQGGTTRRGRLHHRRGPRLPGGNAVFDPLRIDAILDDDLVTGHEATEDPRCGGTYVLEGGLGRGRIARRYAAIAVRAVWGDIVRQGARGAAFRDGITTGAVDIARINDFEVGSQVFPVQTHGDIPLAIAAPGPPIGHHPIAPGGTAIGTTILIRAGLRAVGVEEG